MKNAILVSVFIGLSIFIAGCSEETTDGISGTPETQEEQRPANIDLTGAKSGTIAKKSTMASLIHPWYSPLRYYDAYAADGSETTLYKKTDDGEFIEVTYTDPSGDVIITTYSVIEIDRMSSAYTMLYFGGVDRQTSNWRYVVNNVTGTVFDFTDEFIPVEPWLFFKDSPMFQVDASNDMYYLSYESWDTRGRITKINSSGMSVSVLSPDVDHVKSFAISSVGGAVFLGNDRVDILIQTVKAVSPSGKVTDIASGVLDYLSCWTGLDGELYLWKQSELVAKKVVFDLSGDATLINYGTAGNFNIPMPEFCNITKTLSRVFQSCDASSGIYDVYNPAGEPTETTYASKNISSVAGISGSTDMLYAAVVDTAGDSTIIEFADDMSTQQNLLTPTDYQVDKVKHDGTDELLFYGIRNADQVKFFGTVNTNTLNVTTLATGTEADVLSIEKLN